MPHGLSIPLMLEFGVNLVPRPSYDRIQGFALCAGLSQAMGLDTSPEGSVQAECFRQKLALGMWRIPRKNGTVP